VPAPADSAPLPARRPAAPPEECAASWTSDIFAIAASAGDGDGVAAEYATSKKKPLCDAPQGHFGPQPPRMMTAASAASRMQPLRGDSHEVEAGCREIDVPETEGTEGAPEEEAPPPPPTHTTEELLPPYSQRADAASATKSGDVPSSGAARAPELGGVESKAQRAEGAAADVVIGDVTGVEAFCEEGRAGGVASSPSTSMAKQRSTPTQKGSRSIRARSPAAQWTSRSLKCCSGFAMLAVCIYLLAIAWPTSPTWRISHLHADPFVAQEILSAYQDPTWNASKTFPINATAEAFNPNIFGLEMLAGSFVVNYDHVQIGEIHSRPAKVPSKHTQKVIASVTWNIGPEAVQHVHANSATSPTKISAIITGSVQIRCLGIVKATLLPTCKVDISLRLLQISPDDMVEVGRCSWSIRF